MRAVLLAAFAVLLVWAGPTVAAEPSASMRAAAIRAAVEPLRVRAAVPAIGLAVIDKGEIVFEGGFGEVGGRPATERDRFRAASISKLFTAQAVMQLVDSKRLALDDDAGRWLPAVAGKGLTIRRLLTHHAGLRDLILPVDSDDPARPEAYLKVLAGQTPARPTGAAYAYTDADYNLLGAVVAAAAGRPYVDVVQTKIVAPLGLADTSIFPARDARAAVVPPTLPPGRTARPWDVAFAPSEGLTTSAHDLAVWTRAVLKRDRRLLSAASHRAMLVGQDDAGTTNSYAALGWKLRYEGARLVAEHGGSVRGYTALVLAYPEEARAFVILTNAEDSPRWEIARALDAALTR